MTRIPQFLNSYVISPDERDVLSEYISNWSALSNFIKNNAVSDDTIAKLMLLVLQQDPLPKNAPQLIGRLLSKRHRLKYDAEKSQLEFMEGFDAKFGREV